MLKHPFTPHTWIRLFTLIIVSSWCLVLSQAAAPLARANEKISHFASQLTILPDTSLDIQETITYDTDTAHHGIYRYLPLSLTTPDGKRQYHIQILAITDAQGRAYPYEQSNEEGNLTLKIGDPDSTFVGTREYMIHYQVDHALTGQPESAELYWDITGEGWSFPIETAEVHLLSPSAGITRLVCYTGAYGSTQQQCRTVATSETDQTVSTTTRLQPGDNFTIRANLSPQNDLVFPSQWERLGFTWWVWPLFLCLPLPLMVMVWLWWRKGRDWVSRSPHVLVTNESYGKRLRGLLERRPAPFVYEPFQDLSPAEVEAIQKENISPRALVAEILDLARQKHIRLSATEKKKLFGKETMYTLHKLRSAKGLRDHQAYLHQALFETGDTVALEDLKGTFYKKVDPWKSRVWASVVQGGYFTADPKKTRLKYFGIAMGLVVVAWVAWGLLQHQLLINMGLWLVGLFPLSILTLTLPHIMPQKTVAGWRVQQLARGLQKTIERGKWREEIKEKHLFIEEVFPFAVVFGVVQKLAHDMEDLGEQPPEYVPSTNLVGWQLSNFTDAFVDTASSQLTYNPNSGSGSGGGGFSGGGGGGGGGGSW